MHRLLKLVVVPSLIMACDPYELASSDKFSKLTTCELPLGTPEAAHITPGEKTSALSLKDGAGVVVLQGSGTHSVYGDPRGPWMRNVLPDPDGCGEGVSDVHASRAFWGEVQAELRARVVVMNGEGAVDGLLTIKLIDWADLDGTIELVNRAMTKHQVCSRVALEVRGLTCALAL